MSSRTAFDCPECGARLRGGRPGAVLACAECRNPVVVPEPAAEPVRKPAPAAAPPPSQAPDPDQVRRKLWLTATGVIAVVALAHLGLFLLLTRDARASMQTIQARHAVSALEDARAPKGEPRPGTPEYKTWREAKALWVDAEAWRNDRRQVGLLRGGILGSFLVQVAITGWILVRLLGKLRRRRA